MPPYFFRQRQNVFSLVPRLMRSSLALALASDSAEMPMIYSSVNVVFFRTSILCQCSLSGINNLCVFCVFCRYFRRCLLRRFWARARSDMIAVTANTMATNPATFHTIWSG